MNSGRIAKALRSPASSRDDGLPEYVVQFEKTAAYLPREQLPLLRRAWEVGAAAHAGQTRKLSLIHICQFTASTSAT